MRTKLILFLLLLLVNGSLFAQEKQMKPDSLIYSTRTKCNYNNQNTYDLILVTVRDTGSVKVDSVKFKVATNRGNGVIDTTLISALDVTAKVDDTIAVSKSYEAHGSQLVSIRTYLIGFLSPQNVIVFLSNLEAVTNRKTWITFLGINYKN